MKPAPSSASFRIGSSVRSKVCVAGPVLKVGNQDRDGLVRDRPRAVPARATRSGRAARRTPRATAAARRRVTRRTTGSSCPRLSRRFNAATSCGVVWKRSAASGSMHCDTMPVERFGNARIDRARRRRRRLHPPGELSDGRVRAARPLLVEQHVVDDQAERVDVGALVDRLRPRLFGRHVLDRSDHRADHRLAHRPG